MFLVETISEAKVNVIIIYGRLKKDYTKGDARTQKSRSTQPSKEDVKKDEAKSKDEEHLFCDHCE